MFSTLPLSRIFYLKSDATDVLFATSFHVPFRKLPISKKDNCKGDVYSYGVKLVIDFGILALYANIIISVARYGRK